MQVEHANGVIKARFQSLKKIPIEIRTNEDMPRCATWITACVLLHNVLIYLRDEFEYEVVRDEDDDDGLTAVPEQSCADGKFFQNAVRDRWLKDVQGWR